MGRIVWIGRVSLFIIYFWFGILKVIGVSPAENLVESLFADTIGRFIEFSTFTFFFGMVECLIGTIWIFPKFTKIAFWALIIHMGATFLPVLVLPGETWQYWFTPTLVGQYIIKNFALISTGLFIRKIYENELVVSDSLA